MRELELWRDKVMNDLHFFGLTQLYRVQIQLRVRDRIQTSASYLTVIVNRGPDSFLTDGTIQSRMP